MADWISSLGTIWASSRLASLDVREWIILLVLAVVVYMLVVILRIKSLGGRRQLEEAGESEGVGLPSVLPPEDLRSEGEPSRKVSPAPENTGAARKIDAYRDPSPRNEPKNKYFEPPDPPPSTADAGYGEAPPAIARLDQERLHRLERDLASTREELDALRSAFADERERLRGEIERLKATQRVSPTYNESLQMAMSGASAEEIAASCGIARAEAELVLSLVRGGQAELAEESPGSHESSGLYPNPSPPSRYGSRHGSY